jgi:3-oxoacyl-(acyl-carrier-protein) synthase III
MSIKIIGTGCGFPKKAVSNAELCTLVDTSDEWIISRTGIKSRYICTDESLTDLCQTAAEKAIMSAGLTTADIDLIICSTLNGDYITPSLACSVVEQMKMSCPGFDVNAACAGFIYALSVAEGFILTKRYKNILIISAERMSKHADWRDRSTCVLFGDGAGACVVTEGNALRYIKLTVKPDASLLHIESGNGNSPFAPAKSPGYLRMKGQDVFKFAVTNIDTNVKLALDSQNMTADDIDYYVFHQANKRIIDYARGKLGQPEEKIPLNIENYGNISSATIPILLDKMVGDGRIRKGTRLLLTAFGAGLTTGTCVIVWE